MNYLALDLIFDSLMLQWLQFAFEFLPIEQKLYFQGQECVLASPWLRLCRSYNMPMMYIIDIMDY